MRLKTWMIVVTAVALCVAWTWFFWEDGVFNLGGPYYMGGDPIGVAIRVFNAGPHGRLVTEIGATILAALAVGFWTARRPR